MTSLDLRPLKLGEILDRTFSLYRRNFLLFAGVSGIPHLLTLGIGLLVLFLLPQAVQKGQEDPSAAFPWQVIGASVLVGLITVIVTLIVYLVSQGATVFAVSELYLGRSISISEALRRVRGALGTLFGVIFLGGLITGIAGVFLIIPGIYVACRFLASIPSALIERRGVVDSLSRSWELTKDFAGRAFVIYLLYFVIASSLEGLLALPLAAGIAVAKNDTAILSVLLALNQVINAVIETVLSPILLIAASVYYFDLRVRKEAFDLQFMMDPTSDFRIPEGRPLPSILP